jgi:transcriptional regulator with XRE-family HTH domain
MADFYHLGQYLKQRRVDAGYSQVDLADKLGFASGQFVSNWERGICAPPGDSLQKMITLLKLDREKIVHVMVEDSTIEIRAKVYTKPSRSRKKSS